MTGAIKALQIAETTGLNALELNSRLYLNTWRLNDVWDDDSIEDLLQSIVKYEPISSPFEMPDTKPEIITLIPIYELIEKIKANRPMEDILQFVMDDEENVPLVNCMTATINALVNFDGEELSFGPEIKMYNKHKTIMEAIRIGIK